MSELLLSSLITSKIQDGEIFASINQKDGMVVFHTNPESYESVGMLNVLKHQVCDDIILNLGSYFGKKVMTNTYMEYAAFCFVKWRAMNANADKI